MRGVMGIGAENLEIQVHFGDFERDVLLGFPLDRSLHFLLGHDRQLDLADDDRVPRNGRSDIFCLESLAFHQPLDDLDNGTRVHNRVIDDRFGGQHGHTQPGQLIPAFSLFKVHHLDRTGADIDADNVFFLLE